MDLGGAWNDAVVRRRFAIGAWLFMAVVPSVLPGVLVSWQADVRAGVVMAIGVRPLLALAAAIALLCSACLGTHFTLRRRFGGTG
jgi:hypothetical protein